MNEIVILSTAIDDEWLGVLDQLVYEKKNATIVCVLSYNYALKFFNLKRWKR